MSAGARSEQMQKLNVWFTFVIASVALFSYAIHAGESLLDVSNMPYRVLASFYASGLAAAHGLNPYAFYSTVWHFHAYDFHTKGPIIYDVNLSPPWMMPLFSLLARVPIRTGVVIWTSVSLVLFLASAAIVVGTLRAKLEKRKILWLLLSTSVLDTLWLGQDYALLFLLSVLVWLLLKRDRAMSAAVLIGILVAIKPNLGLWPVLLWFAGSRKQAIVSAATAMALSASALFMYGPRVYLQWIHADALVPHWIYTIDSSFGGIFARLGVRPIGTLLAYAGVVALSIFVRRTRPSGSNIAGLAICAGVLCAPLGWFWYTLFAAPFFVTVKHWGWLETLCAVLLSYPTNLDGIAFWDGRPWVVFLFSLPRLIGVALMLFTFARSAMDAAKPQDAESAQVSHPLLATA